MHDDAVHDERPVTDRSDAEGVLPGRKGQRYESAVRVGRDRPSSTQAVTDNADLSAGYITPAGDNSAAQVSCRLLSGRGCCAQQRERQEEELHGS
jgi:hypothetical protein